MSKSTLSQLSISKPFLPKSSFSKSISTMTATAVTALSAALCSPGSLAADSKGTFSLSWENDLFTTSNDDNYTNGLQLSYVSDTYMPDWLAATSALLPFADSSDDLRMTVSLGQKIYTPRDLSRTDVIQNDRPYAGWLYLSAGLLADSYSKGSVRHVDSLQLIVGTVGPNSGAESVQTQVHDWTDSEEPMGWDNQLDNEVTVDLRYQHQWMIPVIDGNVDIVPQVSTMLGSSQRNVGTGLAIRFGSGLQSDFGPPLIDPDNTGGDYFKPDQSFYWYVFAGAYGRYVDYNIFLEGNRDGDSHSVEPEEWVGDLQAGLVMGAGNWRFTMTNIFRTEEFEGQEDGDQYGSVSASYRF
ncbi:lipid A deacylase LpxR family protein [Pseudomaricurvus sp.]|uniref:lipid A deacylase LpxR family protein n=1 Tax=Pseudomaricurvus sp. TaxID=2004510 RepID=UPI003F6BDB73